MIFKISTSVFFRACRLGFLMVTSTSTSSPKTCTLVTAPLSTKFWPSPGADIFSNALRMSAFFNFIVRILYGVVCTDSKLQRYGVEPRLRSWEVEFQQTETKSLFILNILSSLPQK